MCLGVNVKVGRGSERIRNGIELRKRGRMEDEKDSEKEAHEGYK